MHNAIDAAAAPAAPRGKNANRVHRFEVRLRPGHTDPRAAAIVHDAASLGVSVPAVRVTRVYLIEGPFDAEQLDRFAAALLTDPVLEVCERGASAAPKGVSVVEVHPLPGVMDPPAQTVAEAVAELVGADSARALTGWRYEFEGVSQDDAARLAERLLANTVIQGVHTDAYTPASLPAGSPAAQQVRTVPILGLDDAALQALSRETHLFLSLQEMHAIQSQYASMGREPTDIELETLAQTWSEHCVHKTLKAQVLYEGTSVDDDVIDWANRPGHTVGDGGSVRIDNLLKSTVAAATHELIADGVDWTLSVFVDNAGIIEFDESTAVCVKVETHNHPSAIEPYGGAATGVGGCVRDILGTGLGAKPIANTDVFCVASPDMQDVPAGCLHPKRVLTRVVAGVRDYGNRIGVPTVSGAVWFDDRYVGNPLVYCGSVGVMPRDRVKGDPKQGDLIVAVGGRTGRDGVHGATFSSAELTDTHADEFSHAVQIGNAIEEKKVIDAVLRARDTDRGCLFSAITDCGAGGFSSAVGEMGEKLGADVDLSKAPLKYDGLSYTEIWISEAQERMVLAVPAANLDAMRSICEEESVELAVLGTFGTEGAELVLRYGDAEVGRLPMGFLHDGVPMPTRTASWSPASLRAVSMPEGVDIAGALQGLLSHRNIASKRWIVRQYDHEVQAGTVIKPLVGPTGDGPGNASVLTPVPGSRKGLAVSQGLATGVGDAQRGGDPYLMALAAVDECVRNLVCVGADPSRTAILDNFCWPSCDDPANLGSLVRAAEGCYDAAKAYRTPFVSGKDSLHNQFTTEDGRTIAVPPTLLISGIGIVHDTARCVTMDLKAPGSVLLLVGPQSQPAMAGSHLEDVLGTRLPGGVPMADLSVGPVTAQAVSASIAQGLVRSAHDVSDGGVLTGIAEMCIAADGTEASLGAALDAEALCAAGDTPLAACFGEGPSRYVLEVDPGSVDAVAAALGGAPWIRVGVTDATGSLSVHGLGVSASVTDLKAAWLAPLNW